MEEIDIEKMHQFEDVINMEIFYNKTTQEIMEQYYLQRKCRFSSNARFYVD